MDTVIETNSLTKRFGDFMAVDAVSFQVQAGEVLGYLGPNGSGKTTTIRMLMGLLLPSAGSARVLDYDIVRHPEQVDGLGLLGVDIDDVLIGHLDRCRIGDLGGQQGDAFRTRVVGVQKGAPQFGEDTEQNIRIIGHHLSSRGHDRNAPYGLQRVSSGTIEYTKSIIVTGYKLRYTCARR